MACFCQDGTQEAPILVHIYSQIKRFVSQGIPFDNHLHVHHITGYVVCQREDEGHLFKVIASLILKRTTLFFHFYRIGNILRQGRMPGVGMERFLEALKDKEAGLTYIAVQQ